MLRPTPSALVALVASLLLAGCAAEPEAPAARAAESAGAGVRVTEVPEVFVVAGDDAEGLRLEAPSLPGPSELRVTLSPEYPGGLNIVDSVQTELDKFEARPGGESFGQTQLVAPIGLTYMARGRWDEGATRMEELKAMVAHPWGNRLLILSYRYPLGEDTQDRGAQLMELLGEIEALEQPPPAPESGG